MGIAKFYKKLIDPVSDCVSDGLVLTSGASSHGTSSKANVNYWTAIANDMFKHNHLMNNEHP